VSLQKTQNSDSNNSTCPDTVIQPLSASYAVFSSALLQHLDQVAEVENNSHCNQTHAADSMCMCKLCACLLACCWRSPPCDLHHEAKCSQRCTARSAQHSSSTNHHQGGRVSYTPPASSTGSTTAQVTTIYWRELHIQHNLCNPCGLGRGAEHVV
jgi:hypothetical protein